MAITIEGQVGPRTVSDGSNTEVRQTRSGGLVTADGHGRYTEQALRKTVFATSTALTGVTVAAGMVSPVAAAATSLITLYNPLDSGVDLEVLRVYLASVSGTPGAGSPAINLAFSQTITAAQNATPQCSSGTSNSRAKAFSNTALTGSGAQVLYRPLGPVNFAAALAASAGPLAWMEELAGEVVLPPGGICSVALPAAGTTWVVVAGIVFAEYLRVS